MGKIIKNIFLLSVFICFSLLGGRSVCNASSSVDTPQNVATASAVSEAERVPERVKALEKDCRGDKLQISSAAAAALEQWDPGFVVWKPGDYALKDCLDWSFRPQRTGPGEGTGDFNGDGRADFVFAGHDTKKEWLVVLLSTGSTGFRVVPISSSNSYGEDGVSYCELMYNWGLGSSTNVAVYSVLPKGTWFYGNLWDNSAAPSIKLKRDAFIAARVAPKFGTKEDHGFHGYPFAAFEMFQWMGHESKQYRDYIKSNPKTKAEFLMYFAYSIRLPGMRKEELPPDMEGL